MSTFLSLLAERFGRCARLALVFIFTGASLSYSAPVRRQKSTEKSTPAPPTAKATPEATQEKALPVFNSKLESFTRSVEVQREKDNGWKKAKPQTDLATSDKVRTGRRSVARIKLGDGSKVLLLQNSQAEMENLSSVEKTIKLLKGRVRAIVAKINGGNNFKIKTPVGVASVRGTEFTVGYDPDNKQSSFEVAEGLVVVAPDGDRSNEITLGAGERILMGPDGFIGEATKSGGLPLDENGVREALYDSRVKDSVVAMAAEESRTADFQTGKSLTDINGERVRVEQYIMRPRADQFKLVVLNERPARFDYFTYQGTFNQNLPEDLSVALKEVGGKLGTTSPDYYLTDYTTLMSNTLDNITDSASGGHLVKVTFDGTNYTLTDNTDSSNTRTIEAAALQSDGSYKIYNPLRDTFSLVSAANKAEAIKIGVLDSLSGQYRNLESGDTYWKTRFNTYSSFVNSTAKMAFSKKTFIANTLAIDLDANFTNAPITAVTEYPSGVDNLHNRLSVYYSDGSRTTYNNYIIDDEGTLLPTSTFAGLSNSADYKNKLDLYNYETVVTATEMGSRKIDLIADPRLFTKSGLIQ